jgi:hypothetical protein
MLLRCVLAFSVSVTGLIATHEANACQTAGCDPFAWICTSQGPKGHPWGRVGATIANAPAKSPSLGAPDALEAKPAQTQRARAGLRLRRLLHKRNRRPRRFGTLCQHGCPSHTSQRARCTNCGKPCLRK